MVTLAFWIVVWAVVIGTGLKALLFAGDVLAEALESRGPKEKKELTPLQEAGWGLFIFAVGILGLLWLVS